MSRARSVIVALACLAAAPAMAASPLNFLNNTPIAKFSKSDRKILRDTVIDMLTNGQEGQTKEWKNEKGFGSGSLKLEKIYTDKDRPCRTLTAVNHYKTLRSEGTHSLCQRADGEWIFVE